MLRYMTAGESHGKALIAIIDGVPAGLTIDEKAVKFIWDELHKRMSGYGRGARMAIETDCGKNVEILSGIRKGVTIGSPVAIELVNNDFKINDLPDVKCPRPGHADLAGMQKYNFKDARDVLERASARETAARVAVGAVIKLFLKEFGIRILSHVTMIGRVKARTGNLSFDEIASLTDPDTSPLRCADKNAEKKMCKEIDKAKAHGDTLGGAFEVVATGVPSGLGSYVQWDKRLDAELARLIVSIPAVKAVSIGEGIAVAANTGSETHDPIEYDMNEKIFKRTTNNAGGIEGGMTNGMPVIITGFMKPIATLKNPLKSVDIDSKKESTAATERSDVTAVAACGVVAESMAAFGIGAAFLDKFGGDSMREVQCNYGAYMEYLKKM
ncbi:MAG: chorismate synthase [Candidatus Omnitrophota bacterium]|nr:chorismate synthase [Candidatus Omnitrophota bacterium]MBU1894663.1 chorismate synthase [Candidatus Omnitrophota bacterium]